MYTGQGIDREVFNKCFCNTVGRVRYELGAKPALDSDSSTFDASDCSGFTAWMLSRSTQDMISAGFGGGSVQQHEWCKTHLLPVEYQNALIDRENRIYLAFMAQDPTTHVVTRHVWFLQNGATIECCGGDGVTSSQEHASAYSWRCSGCFVVPSYIQD